MQRATWTDERLDQRFEELERRFDRIDDGIRRLTAILVGAGLIIAALVGVLGGVVIDP